MEPNGDDDLNYDKKIIIICNVALTFPISNSENLTFLKLKKISLNSQTHIHTHDT